ncbi:RNA small subunit methyltransferase [Pochonia chlamydosporia 170]|uniref:RNA small subunit methyltransferase n=1 Tax=Pochonia chlamydosporia 170 TaxID=1380566 RepID=A0A179FH22_METCM|nr:RNA small subunit methyltransferase [Pochonia chlamydosporia 170]OAQ64826.1 RNA small subunit methyltransferase [Pochonia chlamydosporia 170]
MTPRPLPYNGNYASPDDYISHLLHFVNTTDLFQILCGGTHILDFFTSSPGLFHTVVPQEWHPFLLECDIMRLLDIFIRDDLDHLDLEGLPELPDTLFQYIKSIRDLSLGRDYTEPSHELPVLPRIVKVGMKPKKIHEVSHFADYVHRLSQNIASASPSNQITHFVDFGSGQNYLGRALASEPYNQRVVAVEGRENNVTAARGLDMSSGLAVKQKVKRNKKLWTKILEAGGPNPHDNPDVFKQVAGAEGFDFRPRDQLHTECTVQHGKGHVQYVSGRLDSGDLSEVISTVQGSSDDEKLKLMAISIHSCGNLSHYAIRSLILNQDIRAIAIVGCCYNLMTEKLGPPTYKHAYLRPTLQALNGRVGRESSRFDPQGFPMSHRFSTYDDDGIRLNVTARMMACQAPRNWGLLDSEAFFSRHFFRAVLQKIFLDRGVVQLIHHVPEDADGEQLRTPGPFDFSTQPITVGGLRKNCYSSLRAYVRGTIEKLTTSSEYRQYADVMNEKMADITDDEIDRYEAEYLPRKKELCVVWSLMAYSAMVVESLIVVDRWMYLREQDEVGDAWVETVFDYGTSPRNLVVVGVKKGADVAPWGYD